jgi:GTPase SAR1 family protein
LLVFDLTDEKTFLNLETWMEDVRLYSSSAVEIMCVGNKCDLEAERGVDFEDAMSYCEKNRFLYFETSAKTHVNIDKALTKLTQIVYAKKIKTLQQHSSKTSTQDHGRHQSTQNANQSPAKGVSLKTGEQNNHNNSNSSPCLC